MRENVKARKVGESLVVTITKTVAEASGIEEGDPLIVEVLGNGRLMMIKDKQPNPTIGVIELELELLESRRHEKLAERELMLSEYNNSMPSAHPGIDDGTIMEGTMKGINWDIAKLDTQIAEKRLELFKVGGRAPRFKFDVGDRVTANNKAPSDYRGRSGTIAIRGPGKAEYGVMFDGGTDVEYLNSWWLELTSD